MSYVVKFNCPKGHGEACIVNHLTEEECWQMVDGLGCRVLAVYPLARVTLKAEPWVKDGYLRCQIHEVTPQ